MANNPNNNRDFGNMGGAENMELRMKLLETKLALQQMQHMQEMEQMQQQFQQRGNNPPRRGGGSGGGQGSRYPRPTQQKMPKKDDHPCHNCDGEDHKYQDCVGPLDEEGYLKVKACPKCDDKSHTLFDCRDASLRDRWHHLLQLRNGKPPISWPYDYRNSDFWRRHNLEYDGTIRFLPWTKNGALQMQKNDPNYWKNHVYIQNRNKEDRPRDPAWDGGRVPDQGDHRAGVHRRQGRSRSRSPERRDGPASLGDYREQRRPRSPDPRFAIPPRQIDAGNNHGNRGGSDIRFGPTGPRAMATPSLEANRSGHGLPRDSNPFHGQTSSRPAVMANTLGFGRNTSQSQTPIHTAANLSGIKRGSSNDGGFYSREVEEEVEVKKEVKIKKEKRNEWESWS